MPHFLTQHKQPQQASSVTFVPITYFTTERDMFTSMIILNRQLFTKGVGKKRAIGVCTLLVLCMCNAVTGLAQSFTTTVSANKIGKNQYAVVSYDLSGGGRIESFAAPQFKDWNIASGPNNSSYSSVVNGTVSRRTSISYYLQPKKTGKLIIEGATIKVDGKQLTSNSAIVEVLNKNVDEQAQQSNNSDPFASLFDDPVFSQEPERRPAETEFDDAPYIKAGEDLQKKINQVLLLKVTTSKNTCYEGEPIMATYKLYARVDVEVGFSKRPSFSGFSAFDMEEPSQNYTYEMLNGKQYKVYTIRKVQLYPLQNGTLTLDPVELECKMRFIKYEAAAAGNFDAYDNNNFLSTSYTLKSPAINIAVQPLPAEGKPVDFSGAVGNFSINAITNTTETGRDDATTLQVSISGSGNFSMVAPPVVAWPKGVEAYDPAEKENLIKSVMPISGDKKFDYVFLSHQPGKLVVPAVSFSYFDPATKKYKTIATKPIDLTVAPESKKPRQQIDETGANWPLIFVAIAKYVLPILAIVLVLYLFFSFLVRKKRRQQNSELKAMDEAWERMMNDSKVIQKPALATTAEPEVAAESQDSRYMPLSTTPASTEEATAPGENTVTSIVYLPQAEATLWMPDHKIFYQALKNDIVSVLSGLAGTNSTNKTAVMALLQQRGADTGVLQQLNSIMDECDAALYSPVLYDTDRQKTLDEVKYLLGQIKGSSINT